MCKQAGCLLLRGCSGCSTRAGSDRPRLTLSSLSPSPPLPLARSLAAPSFPALPAPIDTVAAFMSAIGRGVGAKVLAKKADLTWEELFKYNHEKWDACGITMKERK